MIRFICDRCGKEWEMDTMLGGILNFPKEEGQHIMVTAMIDGNPKAIQLCDECEKKIYDQIFAYKHLNHEKDKKKTTKDKEEHCYA